MMAKAGEYLYDDEIETLTRAGRTAIEIAALLGITTRTVHRARGRRGIAQPYHPSLTTDELAKALTLLQDGSGYAEAARTIGRSADPLRLRLPGYGLDRREQGRRGRLARLMNELERQ